MNEDFSALKSFGGVARLFPLPNLVFFPHVVQPLHIFEARYRSMTADALADDRLIALVQLKEGSEEDLNVPPPIHSVACLGRIVADQQQEDGRYNLLLRGLSRIRIEKELKTNKPYRDGQVELLHDRPIQPAEEKKLRGQLTQCMPVWFPSQAQVLEQFQKLLDSNLTLSALCDIFCFALPLDAAFKQRMLESLDVAERTTGLFQQMEDHLARTAAEAADRKFPPDFSSN